MIKQSGLKIIAFDSLDEAAESLSAGTFVGNLIDVRSSRKLTELQMWLAFSSPRDLHWVLYEQVGEQLITRADKLTSSASSTGFVSSGPLSFNYQLEAGKRYAFGMIIAADCVGFDDVLPFAGNPSFGTLVAAERASPDPTTLDVPLNLALTVVSYMQVVTTSP